MNPMKIIDRTKAVTQHFLKNLFKKLYTKKKRKIEKSKKHQNIVFLNVCSVMMLYVLIVSFCLLVFVRAILSWCP